MNAYIKAIADIMRRSGRAGALQYVPELTWMLFLRILDERERRELEEAAALGLRRTTTLDSPYRWFDWAAPYNPTITDTEGRAQGWKRRELQMEAVGAVMEFVNGELIPVIRRFAQSASHGSRQHVLSQIFANTPRTYIDTEYNLLEILDRVHQLNEERIDTTHIFPLSQVYEGLLLSMGQKNNDGGQFFTPREVIRVMVQVVNPQPGQTVYDPGAGTGGFLVEAFTHMLGDGSLPARQIARLKQETFFGREKDALVYPIALANMVLHGIDVPHMWLGNTLTGDAVYDRLFEDAPSQFNVVLSNPPFGGKESKAAQARYTHKTSATQVLFVQHIIESLRDGGTCGIVLDEGVLFRTNEGGFLGTKKQLTDDCEVFCIVSLPGGVFVNAGAGVKTNLVFFRKGGQTSRIWYYDLSGQKVTKKRPIKLSDFDDFLRRFKLPQDHLERESPRSWTLDFAARKVQAREAAEPYLAQTRDLLAAADDAGRTVLRLKTRLAELADLAARERLLAQMAEQQELQKQKRREARDAENEARVILDAVYDLKAVNPNAVTRRDVRTTTELLAIIEEAQREISVGIRALRAGQTSNTQGG
jgi:type I restriction enzyme M protein